MASPQFHWLVSNYPQDQRQLGRNSRILPGNGQSQFLRSRADSDSLRHDSNGQNDGKTTEHGWASSLLILATVVPLGSSGARGIDAFSKHVVVAQEGHASDVGRDVLRRGGNAIDAAIATAFALAVTLPEAGNLGGGGFIVAYLADRREVVTVDFREMAPRSSSPGCTLMRTASSRLVIGPEPGRPAYPGRSAALDWLTPALERRPGPSWYARRCGWRARGFPISADLAGSLNRQLATANAGERNAPRRDDLGRLGDFPESVAAFGKPDRTPWRAGDRLIQRDLADTLDRIAETGPDEFYTGRTAELIANYMERNSGFVTLDDLNSYQAKLRPPVHTTFRGFEVYSIGPSSAGGVVLCQMLNILERFDLKADGRDSPRTLHRVTEAMRRAFYTRATQLADPDFVAIPVEELTSKAYADKLAAFDRREGHAEPGPGDFSNRAGRKRSHDPSFHDRPGRQRRGPHVYSRRVVWRQMRRGWGGVLAQQ